MSCRNAVIKCSDQVGTAYLAADYLAASTLQKQMCPEIFQRNFVKRNMVRALNNS